MFPGGVKVGSQAAGGGSGEPRPFLAWPQQLPPTPRQTGEAQRLPATLCDTRRMGHEGRTQCHMLLGLPLWGSPGRTCLK